MEELPGTQPVAEHLGLGNQSPSGAGRSPVSVANGDLAAPEGLRAPGRRLHSGASGAVVEVRRGLIDLKYEYQGPVRRGTPGNRRKIRQFTAASRRGLRRAAVQFPWDELGDLALVSVTYPSDFPTDMRVVKRHFRALLKRWERHWGEEPRGIWKLEAQGRGAPHVHFYGGLPRGAPIDEFAAWGFRVWTEITSKDVDWSGGRTSSGLGAGNRFNLSPAWYAVGASPAKIAEYFCRHSLKSKGHSQNEIPESWTNVGRLWGVVGGRRAEVVKFRLCCPQAAMLVRRVLRGLVEHRLGRSLPTKYRRVDGVWAQVPSAVHSAPRLVAWAMASCGCGDEA